MKNRVWISLLSAVLAFSSMPAIVFAEEEAPVESVQEEEFIEIEGAIVENEDESIDTEDFIELTEEGEGEEEEEPEPIVWELDEEGLLTIQGEGEIEDFDPESTEPDESWRQYSASIKSVVIGEGITSVGANAFVNCDNLTKVELSSTVVRIGESAFEYCWNLETINLPDGLESIGEYAFNGCDLQTVVIPDSVSELGGGAFYGCSRLESVQLPAGLEEISSSLFYDCKALQTISIPETVTKIGNYAFSNCHAFKSFTIPDTVESIGKYAFSGCLHLEEVFLPEGLMTIEEYTFSNCKLLKSVVIPAGVEKIGSNAFNNCYVLSSVTLPASLITIDNNAFYNCTVLSNLTLPKGLKFIGEKAFSGCKAMTLMRIPAGVEKISASWYKASPFFGCNESMSLVVELPEAPAGWAKYWNYYASGKTLNTFFLNDIVRTFTWSLDEKGVLTIGGSGTIPSYDETYADLWYDRMSEIRQIVIEDGISGIEDRAFEGCSADYVYIPASVSNIEGNPFGESAVNTKVYAEPEAKPEGWSESWNCLTSGDALETFYGYTKTQYDYAVLPLTVPTVRATNLSGAVKVSWTQVENATGYVVYKYIDGSAERIAVVKDPAETVYKDEDAVENGKKYVYKITAYAGSTKINKVTSEKAFTYFLSRPSVKATFVTGKGMQIEWSTNTKANGYQIKYESKTECKQITISDAAVAKKVIKKLQAGKSYEIHVRAYKEVAGKTCYSAYSPLRTVVIPKNYKY